MKTYSENRDVIQLFKEKWNERLKSVRIAGFIISVCMVILGVLCLAFPMESTLTMEIIVAIGMIIFGIFRIIDHFSTPVYARMGGGVVSGILSIVVGVLLLTSSLETMAYAFGFLLAAQLMMFGIEKISFANKISFYGAEGAGWIIFGGVLNILASVALFILPIASVALIHVYMTVYLLVGGVSLFVDCIRAKNLKADTK